MSRDSRIAEWTEHFRAWNAEDPEGWARSQIDEGIFQYGRLVFLKSAWSAAVVDEANTGWIDYSIADSKDHPDAPCAGIGLALQRALAAGVSREDLNEIARVIQYDALFSICDLLDGSDVVDYPNPTVPKVFWQLFETDDEGNPLQRISGLHESVLSLDPTGREMRPPAQ